MFRTYLLLALALTAASTRGLAQTSSPAPAALPASSALAVATNDTIRLTLPQAEQQFFQSNLAVLAQQYNVTVAQAQAVQARLLDNPSLYVEQDVLRRKIGRPVVPEGTVGNEAIVTVQQLFSLAGRRKAAGQVAQQSAVVEQYNLQDLLRNLRYQLRTTFYDVYFKQQTLKDLRHGNCNSLTRTVSAVPDPV